LVTVSPDVASSTNLGGWINKVGIWSSHERVDWFADDSSAMLRWRESDRGQHIELGIAETNLVGLLGELGATWRTRGQPLMPVGTIYDSFVGRALEPWSFGIYAGGQSILVGTPSGVTLSPEGGAHQSVITPSIGVEQPGCIAWEPAFGQDFEWSFLYALNRLGRPDGTASYFRLSTRPIDQALAAVPGDPAERERRRRQVLAGGYRIRSAAERGLTPEVMIVGMGVILPEVLRAADLLELEGGIGADVLCITSADLLFRAYRGIRGLDDSSFDILDALFPPNHPLPIVSVLDGHPHTLAFLGAIRSVPITCLGVSDFGQSGDVGELYEHFGIDPETIIGATLDLIERYRHSNGAGVGR
jgi:pyruvate dehydrogenase E1 component